MAEGVVFILTPDWALGCWLFLHRSLVQGEVLGSRCTWLWILACFLLEIEF